MSAAPTGTDKTVSYSDGIQLSITDISFAKETAKGPGSFPGREYAVIELKLDNGSTKAISMNTVVITVLNSDDEPTELVYAAEAKVQDFSGSLKPGSATKARYAFAVPRSSRSKVTVVVDFDGVHTSAVFRGKLG